MGNGSYLQKPITNKAISWEESSRYKFAVCQMQGWRKYMEDAYIATLQLQGFPNLAVFGVFDGHGGGEVARFVAAHFLETLVKRKALSQGQIGQALSETFIQVELMLKTKAGIAQQLKHKEDITKTKPLQGELQSGATAVVVVVSEDKIICANAGDSRAAFIQGGKVYPLSYDHKPENPVEKERIEKTGVPIIQGRVNGLNLTRSIGDFSHKQVPGLSFNKQPITCMPDIIEVERIKGKEELLLVGCDGIWEKYGDGHEELCRYFEGELKNRNSSECLKVFFDKNVCQQGNQNPYGRDNMTAILIQFKK